MAELAPTTFRLPLGATAPSFDLPGVDGKHHSLSEFSSESFLLVVFSCNHCPYAQGWEGRLVQIGKEYAPKGLATVVINPNETVNYPDDRLERMVERAREKGYPFPYLRDDSQEVARAYGALVTPHCYLFDAQRKLIYQGRVDDNWQEPNRVKHPYLRQALDAALAQKPIPLATTPVQGCSVKWK
jgi:peroxiredoxin